MLLEFCAENFTHIPEAVDKGIKRVELCDNLEVGGTTPSYGVIRQTIDYCHSYGISVMTMIRPRGGNFTYTHDEIEIMKADIVVAKELGSDGVVFGCLNKDSRIMREQMQELLLFCEGIEVTFHMAFDEIDPMYQKDELDWLIASGITRVLTHGGIGKTVRDHAEWLNELIEYAQDRIEILIGGGITHENLPEVSKMIKTDQFHGTRIVSLS